MGNERLVIVGGGITGLAAAYGALARARQLGRSTSITVLERSARLGGNLVTEQVDGFVLDGGPDSWVVSKPHASALARELGLGDQIVTTRPDSRRYYVAWQGRLHAVPEGIVLGVPTRIGPLLSTSLFSWRGKLRMACEPLVKARRYADDEDESIASFAARRLGIEAADRLVAPLLGGISAGDASELSIRATFPQLVAMERDHGSLVRGMLAARKKSSADKRPSKAGAFESLAGGTSVLVGALADHLRAHGVSLRTGARVHRLQRTGAGWLAILEAGEHIESDALLLAVPAHVAEPLVAVTDAAASQMLGEIRYGSTATVFLAYRRDAVAHPLDGVGFVVPKSAGRSILASTWVSSKWDGRAPEGNVLLRVFVGGAAGAPLLQREDSQLVEVARSELAALMGLRAEPHLTRVFRFDRASAQMRVGHLSLVRSLRERLNRSAPGLWVEGGGYGVVGIPDCIREGQDVGRAMVDYAVERSGRPELAAPASAQNSAGSV